MSLIYTINIPILTYFNDLSQIGYTANRGLKKLLYLALAKCSDEPFIYGELRRIHSVITYFSNSILPQIA